jgi:hypothetical protein
MCEQTPQLSEKLSKRTKEEIVEYLSIKNLTAL